MNTIDKSANPEHRRVRNECPNKWIRRDRESNRDGQSLIAAVDSGQRKARLEGLRIYIGMT